MIGSDHRPATFVATSVLGLSLVLMSATSASATTRNNGLFSTPAHAAATAAPAHGVTVTIVQDGEGASFVTRAKTVADFLAERDVIPGASDYVSPSLDTPLTEGMQIEYRKAVPVSLMFGRQRRDVVTSATSVGALLADQGVTLGPNDRVQPASAEPLAAATQPARQPRAAERRPERFEA